jgi:hypothetical protein
LVVDDEGAADTERGESEWIIKSIVKITALDAVP